MTLTQIIKTLEVTQNIDDIKKLHDMLVHANDVELRELRDSIDLKLEYETEKHRKKVNKWTE